MRVKEELQSSASFTLITGHIETYQIATYSIRTLLKMDYWSPKHVELLNVVNKINHQILCILFDYIYIAKWYTVHKISIYQIFQNTISHIPLLLDSTHLLQETQNICRSFRSLKPAVRLSNISVITSHLTGNTPRLHYKGKPVTAEEAWRGRRDGHQLSLSR